ncbi:MAG: guanine deaminase [Candidatus Zipacnadales bacterium]
MIANELVPSVYLHRGTVISPIGPHALHAWVDGCVAVNSHGIIETVGDFTEVVGRFPSAPCHDWRPAAILPGLIDVHSHIPQYQAVGMDSCELLPWLERFIFPAEAAFANPAYARRASQRFFAAALAQGTTTFLLYATVHPESTRIAFQAAEEAGVRATIGKVMMDRNAPPELLEETQQSLDESESLCAEWHHAANGRLQYAFTPRFAITCSEELLARVSERAKPYGALIQTHLAENTEELRTVAKLFPEARTYTDVYANAGLLGPHTVMAHCLHLSSAEWDRLADTQTRVAHCPSSNFILRSGVFDMAAAERRGVAVGLGTAVGAGPSLSLFEEMTHACFASRARYALERSMATRLAALWEDFDQLPGGPDLYQRVRESLQLNGPVTLVDPIYAFFLATLGGAQVLGMADSIGSLEAGKWADFVVIDLTAVDPALGETDRTPREILSQIVYRTEPAAIRATYVGGRKCFPLE